MATCSKGSIGSLLASSFGECIHSWANQILTLGNTLLGDGEMKELVMWRMNRDFMVFMRKSYPQVADEQFKFGILKAEDNEEEEAEYRVDLNLQNILSSQGPTCRSSQHTPHTSWHTWHIHLSNIWLPKRKFVKSSTPMRLKTRFWSQCNPWKFDPNFQETRSPMRYDISNFFFADFSLRRPRGRTRPTYCSLFGQDTTAATNFSLFMFS